MAKSFKKIGLLALTLSMLASCTGRPIDSSGESKTSSEATTSSTSDATSQTSEGGDEGRGLDLLYPYDPGEINEISVETAESRMREFYITAMGDKLMEEYLGSYLFNFILTHNHFTDEEFNDFITLLMAVVRYADETDNGELLSGKIWEFLSKINMDKLFSLVREIYTDEEAYADLLALLSSGRDFGSGNRTSYKDADAYFGGANEKIHKMVDFQKKAFSHGFGAFTSWYFDDMVDIVLSDSGLYIFRMAGLLANAIYNNLDEKELDWLNTKIFKEDSDAYREKSEELDDWIKEEENMINFINHIGAALLDFDIDEAGWEALFPLLEEIATMIWTADWSDGTDRLISKDVMNSVKTLVKNTMFQMNPLGLRSLFQFIGMFAKDVTNIEFDSFYGLYCEDYDHYDEGGTIIHGGVPPYTKISDLYNKEFGLLTSEQKTSVKQAFAALGVNFDLVMDDMDEAFADPDHDPTEAVGRIIESSITEQFRRKFDVIDCDYGTNRGTTLVLKQNERIDKTWVEDYLKYENSPGIEVDGKRDDDNTRRSDIIVYGDVDTKTLGEHLLHVSFEAVAPNYWGGEDYEYFDGYLPYVVVPADVDYFCGDMSTWVSYSYVGYMGYTYDTSVRNGRAIKDSSGAYGSGTDNCALLLKDANYASYDDYGFRFNVDIYDVFIYNRDLKRFIEVWEDDYYFDSTFIEFKDLDNSTLGRHYVAGEVEIKSEGEVKGGFPIYFCYDVVDYIPGMYASGTDFGPFVDTEIK